MKIVLMESLGLSEASMRAYKKKYEDAGMEFCVYEKNMDTQVQIERAKAADVMILANMPLKKEVVESCKELKFIDVAFTGVDHIPMETARARQIAVSNASGYATQAVAELTISLMIQLLRNTAQVEAQCRKGGTKEGLVGNLLMGKTVGIVGAGLIGQRVAKLCKAFDCQVLANSRSQIEDMTYIDKQVDLDTLLREADLVTLHCPLTSQTEQLINREKLQMMKKTALLINTARGKVVDAEALAEALENQTIRGAASDVFETEPPLDLEHPLLHCPNMLVLPHIGFASKESLEMRGEIVFNNLDAWLAGEQINKV